MRDRRIGRRGQLLGGAVDWMIALIATMFVMIILFILVSSFRNRTIDTGHLEHEVYLNKVYYSPWIFNEVDETTKTVHTGMIDLDKFTQTHLDSANHYANEELASIGAMFTLYDENMNLISVPGDNPLYNNYNIYNSLKDFAALGVRGRGGATMHDNIFPIAYEQAGSLKRGYLRITTVRANS